MYLSVREKSASALAASVIVALIAGMLVFGLQVNRGVREAGALVSVLFRPEPPPQAEQRRQSTVKAENDAPKGAPAPPNLRNRATSAVAPPVRMPILSPPPIVVATQAGVGDARSTGAADRSGPGQGAGGQGAGNGGGGNGGDGGGAVIGPRHVSGRLSFTDLPGDVLVGGGTAQVGVRYTVRTDGRVGDCRIEASSGIASVDAMACRLIRKRFRFRPARDGSGRAVEAIVVENHGWTVEPPLQPG